MSVTVIVTLVMVLFIVLLAIETPVFIALAGSGVVGIMLLRGFTPANTVLETATYDSIASYTLAVIPMYILLGMFALHGDLAARVYRLGSRALGKLPGGIGVATVAACTGFAAVSGSSISTAASIGRISVGEMRRYGYPDSLSAGVVAAAGTLGILIPPSSAMVIYAVLSGESVAQLLAAGVIPGLVLAMIMGVYVMICARSMDRTADGELVTVMATAASEAESNSRRAKQSSRTTSVTTDVPTLEGSVHMAGSETAVRLNGTPQAEFADDYEPQNRGGGDSTGTVMASDAVDDPPMHFTKAQLIRSALWLGAIFIAIFVGIFTGLYTVTESAAVGALIALVMVLVEHARGDWRGLWKKVSSAALESAAVTSMSFSLLVGAAIFSTFLVMARIPAQFAEMLANLQLPSILIVILILLALIPAGMFLESMSLMVIFVPLVHPAVVELGYEGVWFAILFVIIMELGLITPPVGMNVFVVSMTSKVKLETVFRGVLPFCFLLLLGVAILMAFPEIVLWLPELTQN